jgi:anti-sigma factor RsiW
VSDTHVEDELLQRYFDGEIGDRQAARVRAHVDGCPHCGAQLERLSKLHRMLALVADEIADSVHSDALYARVAQGARAAPPPRFGERLRLWWDDLLEPLRPRGVWVPVGVAAVGVAAALLVVVRGAVSPELQRSPEAAVATKEPEASRQRPPRARIVASEIVQVDSGLNAASIFAVEVGEGTSTPVVWIEE